MLNFGLEGRVIMVTGGASGIGGAVVRLAAADGAKVAVVDANQEAGDAMVARLEAAGSQAVAITLDVRDSEALRAAVETTEAVLGPLDGVVAAAGISRPAKAEEMSGEFWSAVIDINLTGMFNTFQAAGAQMLPRRRGSLVAVGSVDSLGGHAARIHYSASKHGVAGLVKSLAIEWGRHGIRTNCVAPGVVDTPLLRSVGVPEHIDGVMCDRTPLGRLSSPEDQAKVALFLLSDAASYVNGVVLPVDGGLTAGFFTHLHGADYGSRALLP
ncbi:NAD(P)-dependent dehydrogenase (short-subunit alcohol dehydrogenase family) [Rhodoligotrophos appendicifer]|uniref:SDR family NAD(P)-dependent oxidoreductase n=1 Tax=Rhodoligotrophos appendicifer TaxID=987056 RepID=UPI0011810F36|nr:SDR family NAD(P)-dependent oxidoreductase [Rhodoligotrophos appendicifer]